MHVDSLSCTTSLGAASASKTYTLKPTDVGTRIVAVMTAFVGAGAASSTSAADARGRAAQHRRLVDLDAVAAAGRAGLLCLDGGWDGAAGLTFTYQWKRCDTNGDNCAAIRGARARPTRPRAADVGQTLEATRLGLEGRLGDDRVRRLAADGRDRAAQHGACRRSPATPTDGQVLIDPGVDRTAPGTTRRPRLAFAYQWIRCDATRRELRRHRRRDQPHLHADARRRRRRRRCDARAAQGPRAGHRHGERRDRPRRTSDATGQIAAQTTQNTTLPHVAGGAFANQTLTVAAGRWNGTGISGPVSYQWVRCDPPLATPTCTNLGPASLTATTYLVQPADVGHYVTVIETVVEPARRDRDARAPPFSKPVLQQPVRQRDRRPRS